MATFTLTDGIDTITGTGAGDTFNGGTNGLQTGDTIDGGGGRDSLDSGVVQNGPQAPTITDVEVLQLDTGGLPFDIANVTGAEVIQTLGSSIVIENVGTDDLSTRFGARNVESGTVNLRFEDGALQGMDDRLNLGARSSNVTFTSDSVFDAPGGQQNQTEDAARIEEIELGLGGQATGGAQFANQVDISDFSAIDTLILRDEPDTGPSKVTVSSTELETVNALNTSGGITLTSDIAGDQRILGGSGDDDFKTGAGNDTLLGGAGADVLNAGGGDNTVFGGAGSDEITSEAGADVIRGNGGDDTIDSGSGDDNVSGGRGDDEISAGDGADRVFGGAGADVLRGDGGADVIFDGAGNDTVMGGGDNDVLIVGAGDDTLMGGGGEDLFFFNSDSTGTNTVEDFTLTSNAATNDRVRFEFDGQVRNLSSQAEFEAFYDANQGPRVTVDNATSTLTIDSDSGTIVLNVSDTDFLLA